MNPRIYASRAAKQAEYREAIAAGFTKDNGGVPAYRAALAAGTVTRPVREHYNKGWYGYGEHAAAPYLSKEWHAPSLSDFDPTITPPVPRHKTHIASLKPDNAKYITACGKFLEDVKVVTDIGGVTCAKCRTNYAVQEKVTKPLPMKVAPNPYYDKPLHIIDPKDCHYVLCGRRKTLGVWLATDMGTDREPTCIRCTQKTQAGHERGCRCARCKPRIYHEDKRYLADVKAAEDEFNARRRKEMEEATARCNHTDPKDSDCLICYPVDDQPTSKITDGFAADEKLDAEIRAKRAADPNWNNREWITTAIDIFQGKIPRPKAKVTSPVPQVQKQPVTPPEPVTKPIAVKPKDHSRVPAVEEL